MNPSAKPFKCTLLVAFLCTASIAHSALEQWTILEVFSNAEGDIQFVELLSPSDVQSDLPSVALISFDETGNAIASINLTDDMLLESTNTHVLFATQAFVDATGLQADLLIPSNFLPTDAGRVEFADNTSILSIALGQLPLNGEQSIGFGGTVGFATPTNSAGESTLVSTPAYARFDVSTNTLQLPLVEVANLGVANVSFSVDLVTSQFTLLDNFYFFAERVQSGETAASISEENILFVPRLEFAGDVYQFEATLIQDNPVVFGNINILNVGSQ